MMNHSCVTNTKTIIDSADGGHLLTTLATRDITRGEQITNQVQRNYSSQDTVMSLSLSPCHHVIWPTANSWSRLIQIDK